MSKKSKKQKEPVFVCPACGSEEVIVRAVTSYMVNSGEFYCHTIKTHDSGAKTGCLKCYWEGELSDLPTTIQENEK